MPLHRDHVFRFINQYKRRDPELHTELSKKFNKPMEPQAERAMRMLSIAPETPMGTSASPTPMGDRVAETIVRPSARPVMIIRDNRVTTEFLGPDSQVWASRIQTASEKLDIVIPSVGRIEVSDNPDYAWLGTGWLIEKDIVVTNRHVASEFARLGTNGGFTFRMGLSGGFQSADIDFLEEFERSASLEFDVQGILWIATPDDPDVAFLRVKQTGGRALPKPILLADSVQPDEFVCTIGYPARDTRVPDQALASKIFNDVYEKKRLAPGQIIGVKDDEITHDCTTLGGNSGSPVVRLNTGEAVALHFSGLYLQANYAVPSPVLKKLLMQCQLGKLPGMAPTEISAAPTFPAAPAISGVPVVNSVASMGLTQTFQMNIPITVTIQIGAPSPGFPVAVLPAAMASSGALPVGGMSAIEAALAQARVAIGSMHDVLNVRLGYRFKGGWITDEKVIVVEVRQKKTRAELISSRTPAIPPQFGGFGVDVRPAPIEEQLRTIGIDLEALEARAKPGVYREPPNLPLDPVKEKMDAIFHLSPDSGFPNLKAFIGRVKKKLTATIYEWEPNHISDALEAAIKPGNRTLKMVTQKKTSAGGTAKAVDDLFDRLGEAKFQHAWASVGAGKIVPSAYHIKVASRDDEEFWLSSGNWKDSNQPDIDPAGDKSTSMTALRKHNREWHAIIKNATLATLYRKYIEWDFAEAQRVPLEEAVEAVMPEVLVPVIAEMEAELPTAKLYQDPLVISGRVLEIQPLLTPDRTTRGKRIFMEFATAMIQKAEETICIENQSFSISDELDEYGHFFKVLKEKQDAGVKIRIIMRDGSEFGASGAASQEKLLERIKDFGLDTNNIKVQKKCHTKGIIVDSNEVMLGSENLTTSGALYNRDASLLVRDSDVAKYFEERFNFDWNHLAHQSLDEMAGGPLEIAQSGKPVPAGYTRVSLGELLSQG